MQSIRWFGRLIIPLALSLAAAGAALGQEAPAEGLVLGVILPATPEAGDPLSAALVSSAERGVVMAEEEFAFNAEMLGLSFSVLTENASGADAAVAAADALVDEHGAYGIIGGFGFEETAALSEWSAERGIPFLNVNEPSDALRGALCQPTTFHVAPSAAMYLDALAGWYVRSGFRQWYFVHADTEEGKALLDRTNWALRERHFGARSVGSTALAEGADTANLVRTVQRSNADLIVLLLGAEEQLRVLSALEEAGVTTTVAGYPDPLTQTRAFFAASRDSAPTLGTGHRAEAWEATLDAYGAREINARYRLRWDGEPMDAAAWATYQGVKILFEAGFLGGSTAPADVLAYLTGPQAVFDVWKGIGASFRPWDHQLRQSLYLAKINEEAEDPFTLGLLVGELPAIYMPGTDPVERLDQLGDLQNRSSCWF